MERWTISKLEFLFWWGFPTLIYSAPIAVAAWLMNRLTNGDLETLFVALAVFGVTVIATVRFIWVMMWADVK